MFHIARTINRLSRLTPRVTRTHIYVPSRCQGTYPLFPPGVTVEEDPKDDEYDTITIGDEVFRRKYSYFSWLCIPKRKYSILHLIGTIARKQQPVPYTVYAKIFIFGYPEHLINWDR